MQRRVNQLKPLSLNVTSFFLYKIKCTMLPNNTPKTDSIKKKCESHYLLYCTNEIKLKGIYISNQSSSHCLCISFKEK
jgi:hypothetical protein